MPISALNHYTIRCTPDELPELLAFYTRFLRLTVGDRPELPVPGYWLYSEGKAVVHLYASLKEPDEAPTGSLDHISFTAHDVEATRNLLRKEGAAFDELPVPGFPLYQMFLVDPKGIKIELTFRLDESAKRQPS